MRPRQLLLLLLPLATAAAEPLEWHTNLAHGLQFAAQKQQPALVYFTASWCAPCRRMAQTTLVDFNVETALGPFTRIKLDVDLLARQSETPAPRAVPTFQILTPDGDEVARTTGYQEAAQFAGWLTQGLASVHTAVARRQKLEQRLADADRLLTAAHTNDIPIRQAAAHLFNLCADTEGSLQQATMRRLTDLANDHPAALLDGLNHPRLATRIAVANLLRSRFGNSFNIDPWAPAAQRQQAVAHWQNRLTNRD